MQISVLQWNVWYKEDIHNIGKFLLENPADIICLQELTRGDQQQSEADTVAYIANKLGYAYHYKDIRFDDNPWTQANAIFTKFPIVRTSSEWINEPTGTGHYDDEYRAYVEATLQVGDREITVGTTHMSYTTGFVQTVRKQQEADKLATIVKSKSDNYIFAGDLNAAPSSSTISKLLDSLKNAGPKLSQNTWTTKPFSYDGFSETGLNWRLDYIFTTDDIKVISSDIIETKYSDHLPIYACFRLT